MNIFRKVASFFSSWVGKVFADPSELPLLRIQLRTQDLNEDTRQCLSEWMSAHYRAGFGLRVGPMRIQVPDEYIGYAVLVLEEGAEIPQYWKVQPNSDGEMTLFIRIIRPSSLPAPISTYDRIPKFSYREFGSESHPFARRKKYLDFQKDIE